MRVDLLHTGVAQLVCIVVGALACSRHMRMHYAECPGNSTLTEGCAAQILFKKRMFRETDETITEPQFVTLSYVQVRALVGTHPAATLLHKPSLHTMHMQAKATCADFQVETEETIHVHKP